MRNPALRVQRVVFVAFVADLALAETDGIFWYFYKCQSSLAGTVGSAPVHVEKCTDLLIGHVIEIPVFQKKAILSVRYCFNSLHDLRFQGCEFVNGVL